MAREGMASPLLALIVLVLGVLPVRRVPIRRRAAMAESGGEESWPVDLAAVLQAATGQGPVWTHQGADLNINLLVFEQDAGVAEHVNEEVDVLVVGIAGEGFVAVDGRRKALAAGQALVIPKGARRAIGSAGGLFAYLTCHRRRAGLWPSGVPRPAGEPAEHGNEDVG
jgi:quercetin dioxygenase-like cupin family protein